MGQFIRRYEVDGEALLLYGGEGPGGRGFRLYDAEGLPVGGLFEDEPDEATVVDVVRVANALIETTMTEVQADASDGFDLSG